MESAPWPQPFSEATRGAPVATIAYIYYFQIEMHINILDSALHEIAFGNLEDAHRRIDSNEHASVLQVV